MYLKFLKDCFTKEECEFLGNVEGLPHQVLRGTHRKGVRYLKDAARQAKFIGDVLEFMLPKKYKGMDLYGVNRMLRVVHTSQGEFFRKHEDGSDDIGDLHSKLTILIYLSDARSATRVWDEPFGRTFTDYPCEMGNCLVFDHGFSHAGLTVEGDEIKKVLRTTVFYK